METPKVRGDALPAHVAAGVEKEERSTGKPAKPSPSLPCPMTMTGPCRFGPDFRWVQKWHDRASPAHATAGATTAGTDSTATSAVAVPEPGAGARAHPAGAPRARLRAARLPPVERRRTPWWMVMLTAVALLMSATALTIRVLEELERDTEPLTRVLSGSELEAQAKIRMPTGSVLLTSVWMTVNRGLETEIWAKIRMPETVLPVFLADSGLPQPSPGMRAVTDKTIPDSDTWRPDRANEVAGAREDTSARSRSVMVDFDHATDVTVYLYIMER